MGLFNQLFGSESETDREQNARLYEHRQKLAHLLVRDYEQHWKDLTQDERIEKVARENLELKLYISALLEVLLREEVLLQPEFEQIVERVRTTLAELGPAKAPPGGGDVKPVFRPVVTKPPKKPRRSE
jgi:hypothetical protein